MGYVYIIKNLTNGKCYIGQSKQKDVNTRWNSHKSTSKTKKKNGSSALNAAFRKHGLANFTFNIICVCFDEDRLEYEKFYIKHFKTVSPKGYNLTDGGESPIMSKETIAKMIQANIGRKHTDEAKRNMSIAQKSSVLCVQKLRLLSQNNTGKKRTDEARRKMSASSKGKPKSEETKKKISESKMGKPGHAHSEETKKKIRDALKGREMVDKRGKNHARSKEIQQFDLDGTLVRTFESANIAGITLKKDVSTICKCARGGTKTAYGFKWKYT
jgi:group I intron endonuclease